MKQVVAAAVLAGALGMLANPLPADAQIGDSKLQRCLNEAVESCDKDFKGGDIYTIAARGYCYMIRTVICRVM